MLKEEILNEAQLELMALIRPKILGELLKKDIHQYDEINFQTLKRFLIRNQATEVGKKFGFKEIISNERNELLFHFKEKIPLTTYQTYEPYIQKILSGEENILGIGQVQLISLTGGTTGGRKVVPNYILSPSSPSYAIPAFHTYAVMVNKIPPNSLFVNLLCPVDLEMCEKTAFGVPIAFSSALMQKEDEFNKHATLILEGMPYEIKKIRDTETRWFIQGLFALCEVNIAYIYSLFPSSVMAFLSFLREHWSFLFTALESKKLPLKEEFRLIITDIERKEFEEKLLACISEERLKDLNKLNEKNLQSHNFIRFIWPGFCYVQTCVTGAYVPFKQALSDVFGIDRAYTLTYAASEFYGGSNFFEEDNMYIPSDETFFEFIPFEELNSNPLITVIGFSNLKENQKYELVITSIQSGFFRYRTGDIVQIKFFEDLEGNITPKFNVIGRNFSDLNVADEMIQEFHITNAINKFIYEHNQIHNEKVQAGMFARDINNYRYVFYFELSHSYSTDQDHERRLSHKSSDVIDQILKGENSTYGLIRDSGAIQQPLVKFVKNFSVKEHMLERSKMTNYDINQNKPSLILKDKEISFFEKRVVF